MLALDSIKLDPPETYWFQTKQIMEMLAIWPTRASAT